MSDLGFQRAPIVVGGLGGSGTRVFAEILRSSGCHIGGNLNGALDYLTFTVLGNRPGVGRPNDATMLRLGRLLRREPIGPSDVAMLLTSAIRPGHHDGQRKRLHYVRRALSDRGPVVDGEWGFKEPNSARVLTELVSTFPDMKFIHVVRHGLDMALSRNINQLRAWGPSLGISMPKMPEELPGAQLEFWLRATGQTDAIGKESLRDRYLLVRYDDLIQDARAEVERIAEFLAFTGDVGTLIPFIPADGSAGRWKSQPDRFSEAEVEAVAGWGFDVS